jgi:hypothetical protein
MNQHKTILPTETRARCIIPQFCAAVSATWVCTQVNLLNPYGVENRRVGWANRIIVLYTHVVGPVLRLAAEGAKTWKDEMKRISEVARTRVFSPSA